MEEPSDSALIITSQQPSQLKAKDKGKAMMIEEPMKLKRKDQIAYDAEVTQKLQEQLHAELEEEARIERENEEEASNAALIKEWDLIEARIDADAQLAKRLQTEERELMTVKEQAKLLMELIDARKKFFAAKRAEEQRNKDFKGMNFDAIKKMFDKVYKHVNEFVFKDAEGSNKSEGAALEQESSKKLKMDEDSKTTELKQLIKVVQDEEIAIDAIPIATKPPTIVDWKIVSEGRKSYYLIIRANRQSSYYYWCNVNAAEGLPLLKDLMLSEKISRPYQRKDKDDLKIKIRI
ncbi:hypothetical protein Tco_1531519 [Tanacetum coccineum]